MTAAVKITTEEQLHAWIERAAPGASVVYYSGNAMLCAARDADADLDILAAAALELELAGKIFLAQRRRSDILDYVAVKRAPPVPKRPARPMTGAPVLAQRHTHTISEDRLPSGEYECHQLPAQKATDCARMLCDPDICFRGESARTPQDKANEPPF